MQRLLSKCAKTLYQSPTVAGSSPFRASHTICKPSPVNVHTLRSPVAQTYPQPFSLLIGRPHIGQWHPNGLVQKNLRTFVSGGVLRRPLVAVARLTGLPMKVHGVCFSRVGFWKSQFLSRSYRIGGNPIQSYGRRWRLPQGFTSDAVVWGLILSNVAVFLLWRVADRDFMMKNFMISVDNIRSGHLHTLITSAFSHIDVGHIVSNMLGLYFFGTSIGRSFGPEYLLKLYFSGAVAGSIFYLVYHAFLSQQQKERRMWGPDPSKVPGLGASGAVNAIMLLNIFLFPRSTIYLEFIIPVPAILFGIFLIGNDIRRILEKDPHISGSAHLGGAAVAAYSWFRLRKGMRF